MLDLLKRHKIQWTEEVAYTTTNVFYPDGHYTSNHNKILRLTGHTEPAYNGSDGALYYRVFGVVVITMPEDTPYNSMWLLVELLNGIQDKKYTRINHLIHPTWLGWHLDVIGKNQ